MGVRLHTFACQIIVNPQTVQLQDSVLMYRSVLKIPIPKIVFVSPFLLNFCKKFHNNIGEF